MIDDEAEHVYAINRIKNKALGFLMDADNSPCEDHCSKFAGKMHPDAKHVPSHVPDHKRGAAPPAHHTKGKMKAQLNPDHGPHR